jgi:hypothetical protein
MPTAHSPFILGTIFLQAQLREYNAQNTRPAEKQKEYNLRYLLAKVRTT